MSERRPMGTGQRPGTSFSAYTESRPRAGSVPAPPPRDGRHSRWLVGEAGPVTRSARLWTVLVLNLALVAALAMVGWTAHSVGVWAEGTDYLADAAGTGIALAAFRLGTPTAARPQGRPKATRYAAGLNAGWLLVFTLAVAAEATDRLVTGAHHVHGLPVLVVSGAAAVLMLAGALVLASGPDESDDGAALSVRAVLLDTVADSAAAGAAAAAGAVIFATGGFYWLDPMAALAISVVVAAQAVRLVAHISRSSAGAAP